MTKKQQLEQFPRLEKIRTLQDIALHALANDRVVWGKWISDPDGGKYRAGISVRKAHELVIVQFRGEGQDIAVSELGYMHEFEPELWQRRVRSETWEPICQALSSAKDRVVKSHDAETLAEVAA